MTDLIVYYSKFGRRMSFAGEWLTTAKFLAECGKMFVLGMDDRVLLYGSRSTYDAAMGKWKKSRHTLQFDQPIYMGKLVPSWVN